jgi:hypothetical protein
LQLSDVVHHCYIRHCTSAHLLQRGARLSGQVSTWLTPTQQHLQMYDGNVSKRSKCR